MQKWRYKRDEVETEAVLDEKLKHWWPRLGAGGGLLHGAEVFYDRGSRTI